MYVCVCSMQTYYPQLHTLTEAGHTRDATTLPGHERFKDKDQVVFATLSSCHTECSILFPAGKIPSCKHCFRVICILTEFNLLLLS